MNNENNDLLLDEMTSNPPIETPTGVKSIYGVFTPDEVKELHEEYKKTISINGALRKVGTALFRHHEIRALSMLLDGNDEEKVNLSDRILSEFCAIQSFVVTKNVNRQKKLHHKAGDFKRDANGDPIERPDKSGYETYKKDEVEYADVVEEVPYYDYQNNQHAYNELKKWLANLVVEPDFKELERQTTSNINYNRGLDIIREITKYYQFENQESFVNRFALLVCNAKSKALNKQPKWPVMFSLVGENGKGKGWFVSKLVGAYDKKFRTQSQKSSFKRLLNSNFNSVMMTRGFIHFDEKNGMDSSQAEQLKTLITEPTVEVERKHLDTKTLPNQTTFFSTTNESIKDIMGLQQDRRLVEFVLQQKNGEIPEDKMDSLLDELWDVMPCEHPDSDGIIHELLDESKHVLDAKMDEIADELFTSYSQDFLESERLVNRSKLKQVVKSHFSSVRFNSLYDWCLKNELLDENKNGHVYRMKKNIAALHSRMEQMRNDAACEHSASAQDFDESFDIPQTKKNHPALESDNKLKLEELAKMFNV